MVVGTRVSWNPPVSISEKPIVGTVTSVSPQWGEFTVTYDEPYIGASGGKHASGAFRNGDTAVSEIPAKESKPTPAGR